MLSESHIVVILGSVLLILTVAVAIILYVMDQMGRR